MPTENCSREDMQTYSSNRKKDATPILMVAIQSESRSLLELSEIAELTVKEQLQTISDVSSVSIWGEKRYSMRLWLDPVKMAGYGITPVDVKNAITNENLELPSGSIEGNTVELTLRTMGQMHTVKEFNNVILKETNGRVVRISDIGYAELGPADIKSYMKMNGVPMVGVVVIPQPGANHIEIADAVYQRMEKMKKDLPDDIEYSYGFDNTKFIRASISEVESTVYEAFALVIIITFLFLRDWRVTLIPCIVIPVSLIGAFFVMYVAGFSINVLTMLATKLLVRREQQSWFYRKTEPFFEGMNRIYSRSLNAFLNKRFLAIPITIITLVLIGYLWNVVPAEMAPLEDRSQINITTRAAEGASYEYIRDYTEDINTLVDSIIPDAAAVTARVSSGSGFIRITLKDLQERDYSQMEVAEKPSQAIRTKTKARAFVQQQSSFGGRRSSMPVQYVLQSVSIEKLQKVLPEFLNKVYDNPTFQIADVDLKFSSPEVRVNINCDKAGTMGVSVRDIAETLQYGLSGQRMGYFYINGKQYEILGQINRQQRNQPSNIKSIYIRNDKGQMIQSDNLVEFVESVAPPKLYHYNRFISATIFAGLAEGKTIGEGLEEMDKIASETLDETFRTALSGDSKDYRESSSSLMFAFILALVLIYLILAAQFESFKDPLIIILTVPLAIAGALVFMYFGDITMNIFSQIGILMLIGLVAKNGILIVEFANQKQEAGENKMAAIRDTALQRLHPILMTSASTVLGLIPLAFATGEGANQRIAMGTAVVGGMLVSTFLTMYIVPAIYSYISTNRIKKEQ